MTLVDKQILKKVKTEEMISNGFKIENLHGVSYDILIDSIILPDKGSEDKFVNKNSYNLRSGETVYIKSDIEIKMPDDCIGKIVERNSVMRMGLEVNGPCYQPGHRTRIFLRVHNIISQDIVLYKGQGIAQIMFERLEMIPDKPYSRDTESSYQNERDYLGVQGQWRNDWMGQLEKYNEKMEELDNTENRIYGNIITIMGVFITIFTLLMFNFSAVAEKNMLMKNILVIDFSLALLLYILLGAIILITNMKKKKGFYVLYVILLAVLFVINIFLWMDKGF